MDAKGRLSDMQKIDRKWVKEENRTFTEYPGLPGTGCLGLETWLELAQFYVEDLRWLLSLDHHKFWSHMMYSEKAHELLVSFLKEYPPSHLKNNLFGQEEMKNIFKEMEHLVFLLFLRLSTEKEAETSSVENLGNIIYNNHLFTVPIILDICLVYGTSNGALVKKMIDDIVTLAPYFLDDFQEIIPFFFHVLKVVKERFVLNQPPKLKAEADLRASGAQDVILYLSDSVATIQRFMELYPNICRFFSAGELITEIVYFYSNILPEIEKHCSTSSHLTSDSSHLYSLIGNVRIDVLKMVKSVLDFVSSEGSEILGKTEMVDEYLTLMTELLSEPVFFSDYNLLYSVEFEIESAVRNCPDVDTVKLNHVLGGVASLLSDDVSSPKAVSVPEEPLVELQSLIAEVKGIFPHLAESAIERWLRHFNNDVERVITAVLENSVPSEAGGSDQRAEEAAGVVGFRGKHRSKHASLSEMLDDREEINAIKGRCTELSFVADEMYDDEYDDTYDESAEFSVKEGDDVGRRGFVVPRVLRRVEEEGEGEGEEEVGGSEGEGEGEGVGEKGRDCFVENPAEVRRRLEQRRAERGRRDLAGRGRGQGQSKEVLRNRGFKEAHKSFMGNHNRKKQASRKLSKGMIFP